MYLSFWDLRALLSNSAIKKALEDLMNYAHSDFQSFPLSHHKVTRTRSHYYSVNSMPLSWDVSAFFSHALYSRSVLHGSTQRFFIKRRYVLKVASFYEKRYTLDSQSWTTQRRQSLMFRRRFTPDGGNNLRFGAGRPSGWQVKSGI